MSHQTILRWFKTKPAVSLLCRNGQAVSWLTAGLSSSIQSIATSANDMTISHSSSAPTLPPSLLELENSPRAATSAVVAALDEQLKLAQSMHGDGVEAASNAADEALSRVVLRSNSVAHEHLDTLHLLLRYNGSIPALRGQTILAKVLNVNEKRVLVDTGFTGLSEVSRNDLTIAHIHTEDNQLPMRHFTSDIRPGDTLRLRVDRVYTPYGDMQLSVVKCDMDQQRRAIWLELRRRMEQQQSISGRVLNECPGGFAVGVAGFVAVLPVALAATATTKLVGIKQDFLVVAMDNARQRITLRDPRLQRLLR